MAVSKTVSLLLADEAETAELARRLAAAARPGDVIALEGDLGAGKSSLARAFIRRLAGEGEDVPSPTFTLVQFYETPALRVAHFDLYRIDRAAELTEIGLDEALDEGAAIIEWPERLEGHLPANRLDIELAVAGGAAGGGADEHRTARLTAHGSWEGRPIEF